jgi:TIR domain
LTADYPDGRWAREELENAIAQRVEREIKVIPILYEPCERPELLRSLRYVDCTSHEPDLFEGQFLQIIDALNEIDLNPYR